MKLTNEEKDEITWRVVDSLYEKLVNELEYELKLLINNLLKKMN